MARDEDLVEEESNEEETIKEDAEGVEGARVEPEAEGDRGPYDPASKDEDVLRVSSVEVAGVLKDDEGNEWAIPADNVEDQYDLGTSNPFEHLSYDPRFHYQLVRTDRVDQKKMEQFVPVKRREVNMPESLNQDYGTPTGSLVQYLDSTLMKIPKVIASRRQAARVREAQRVKEQTEPTSAMLARSARPGGPEIKSAEKSRRRLQDGDTPVELRRTSSVRPTISH